MRVWMRAPARMCISQTLANIQTDHPDFHIDLGNLFMTDKHASRDEAARQYLAQRYYLGLIGCSTPVLLALGTHDGESGKDDDGSGDCLAVWSNLIRKRYFPNPIPDQFYTGNNVPEPHGGLLQNYYAWEWGDALFVVIDPFRYSTRQRGGGAAGDGHWGRPSIGGSNKRLSTAALNSNSSSFTISSVATRPRAAGLKSRRITNGAARMQTAAMISRNTAPAGTLPVHQLLVRNHSRRSSRPTTIFMPGRNWTEFFT